MRNLLTFPFQPTSGFVTAKQLSNEDITSNIYSWITPLSNWSKSSDAVSNVFFKTSKKTDTKCWLRSYSDLNEHKLIYKETTVT